VALYQRACDDGDAIGCARLGFMHEAGRGGLSRDGARAGRSINARATTSTPTAASILAACMRRSWRSEKRTRQKNSWVSSGSGNLPSE
jgi:TPR repeat protein